jgi:hypothetical protein
MRLLGAYEVLCLAMMEEPKPTPEPYRRWTIQEKYNDMLLTWLLLDPSAPGYGQTSPNMVHPTPRERMLAARAKAAQGTKPTQESGASSAGSDDHDLFWP